MNGVILWSGRGSTRDRPVSKLPIGRQSPPIVNPSSSVGKAFGLICNGLNILEAVFLHYILHNFWSVGQFQSQSNQQFGDRAIRSRNHAKTQFPGFLTVF